MHLPYPTHGRTLICGSLFRYRACCGISDQQWAKNLLPFHSNGWSGELRTSQPSGSLSNTWFTVLPAASLTVSCSVLSISCHYPYLLSKKTPKATLSQRVWSPQCNYRFTFLHGTSCSEYSKAGHGDAALMERSNRLGVLYCWITSALWN